VRKTCCTDRPGDLHGSTSGSLCAIETNCVDAVTPSPTAVFCRPELTSSRTKGADTPQFRSQCTRPSGWAPAQNPNKLKPLAVRNLLRLHHGGRTRMISAEREPVVAFLPFACPHVAQHLYSLRLRIEISSWILSYTVPHFFVSNNVITIVLSLSL
jgi:hypothetical protein